jgi:peroxiredoxin
VAISVDPPETTRDHIAKMGFTFTFLSDPKAEVIRRYDLFHVTGGQGGDIARPAEFLIDPSGTVRWVALTDNYWVRARPETVLAEFDRLNGGRSR